MDLKTLNPVVLGLGYGLRGGREDFQCFRHSEAHMGTSTETDEILNSKD